MKFRYLLIHLFIFSSIAVIGQTEGEYPQTELGESNPSDTIIVIDSLTGGPVQKVHNHFIDTIRNPHFSNYHPPGLTAHNDYLPSFGKAPHFSKAVRKGDVHNNRPTSLIKNPHFSTFHPRGFIHNAQYYLRLYPLIRNGKYSMMFNPKDYKHIAKRGIHYTKTVLRDRNKSGIKDIDELELDIINPGRIALSISPNPSPGRTNISPIRIPHYVNNATIQVFDLLGKKVLTQTIYQKNNNSYQLNLSELEKGTYLIRVVFDNQAVMNGKFIKQ